MSPQQTEAAIAAFLRTRDVTRCPTACVAPTHASAEAADRATLRQHAERREVRSAERKHQARLPAVGRTVGARR